MAVILETLSLRQLLAFALLLVGILATFFAVGGKIAPAPSTATSHIASICVSPHQAYSKDIFYDPAVCHRLNNMKEAETLRIKPEQIVFAIRFPHPGLTMSRWFQFLATSIRLEIEYNPEYPYQGDKEAPTFTFNTNMAYRTATNGTWEKFAEAHESRPLVCHFTKSQSGGDDGFYNCEEIPFFEIGAVHYEEYLVNIRLPARKVNDKIGSVMEINFVEIHQNGGFTRMWFTIKTIVGPISIIILAWFAKRVKGLRRAPVLLEKALFALGVTTALMNFPFEWLTLWLNMPFMLLFSDIRQGLFYGMLMCFWIIFTGEHLVDQPERNRLKTYWRQIGAIGFGCISLLVFDFCERGYQLHNPFYTIWATKLGSNLAYAFIIIAAVCACLYFLFLCVMIFRVFWNIRGKRAAIPTMSRARQLQYQGLIYRFEFLMVVTVLCAGLTVVFFIISNVNEAQWKFGDEESTVEISSALFTGIYGMWNTYVFSVVFLYAPSHAIPATDNPEEQERLELRSRTEVRLTEGETEESIVYNFTGKTARE